MIFRRKRGERSELRASPVQFCGNRFLEIRLWVNGERDLKRGLLVREDELHALGLALLALVDRGGLETVDVESIEPRKRGAKISRREQAKENLRAEVLSVLLDGPARSLDEIRRRIRRKRSRVERAVKTLIAEGAVMRVGRQIYAIVSEPLEGAA